MRQILLLRKVCTAVGRLYKFIEELCHLKTLSPARSLFQSELLYLQGGQCVQRESLESLLQQHRKHSTLHRAARGKLLQMCHMKFSHLVQLCFTNQLTAYQRFCHAVFPVAAAKSFSSMISLDHFHGRMQSHRAKSINGQNWPCMLHVACMAGMYAPSMIANPFTYPFMDLEGVPLHRSSSYLMTS